MTRGPFVEAAIRDAKVSRPDERGLMPLEDARALVAATSIYQKGEGEMVGGTFVLSSDRVWAALLSLGDVAEFVAAALRIEWAFHVRGMDNVAALERYGVGILPWIDAGVDERGRMLNVPWCRLPCLMGIGTPAAFEVASRICSVHQEPIPTGWMPGDDTSVLRTWIARHPEVGYRLLAELAQVDPRCRMALEVMAERDPGAVFSQIVAQVGEAEARGLFERFELPMGLRDTAMLALLDDAEVVEVARGPAVSLALMDEAFMEAEGPMWDNANGFTAAMRAIGLVHPEGDALILQALVTGLGEQNIRVELYAYGPHFGERGVRCWESVEIVSDGLLSEWQSDEALLHHTTGALIHWEEGGNRVTLPEGGLRTHFEVTLGGERHDLPLEVPVGWKALIGPVEAVMWQLGKAPLRERVFLTPEALCERFGLPGDAVALFAFDRWQHPHAMEEASGSRDLVAMVEALRRRRRIVRLPEVGGEHPLLDRFELLGGWGDTLAWGEDG